MPFTLRSIEEDLEDLGSRFDGAPELDDEIVGLAAWDAVRVPPGTWRGDEPGPEGLELLVVGAPDVGESPRDDVDGQRHRWADP